MTHWKWNVNVRQPSPMGGGPVIMQGCCSSILWFRNDPDWWMIAVNDWNLINWLVLGNDITLSDIKSFAIKASK